MEGWVKLHRKIIENPIVCKDSDTLSIWIYLLLNATHTEIPALFKKEKIILKEGQLITGILSMSKKLKINKDKIQRTLKCFENDKQIEQQTSNQNRLISILNWNMYQSNDKQIDKPLINKCETNDKPVITNKNVKNDNNIYLSLFNIYKSKLIGVSFGTKIKIIYECKNTNEYGSLSFDEQNKLFNELMGVK